MASKNASTGGEAGAAGEAFAVVGSTIGIKEATEKFEPLVTWQGAFVKARLDGSGLSVDVKGLAAYGQRSVTVSAPVTDAGLLARMESLLRDCLASVTPQLRKDAEVSAMTACLSAASKGEEI